jgi:Hypervirulence associated proteins TUDOR domain
VTNFRAGDRVKWSTHGYIVSGKIVRKITSDTEAAGRAVKATEDEPQYLVRSDNGAAAVHKPTALKKVEPAT